MPPGGITWKASLSRDRSKTKSVQTWVIFLPFCLQNHVHSHAFAFQPVHHTALVLCCVIKTAKERSRVSIDTPGAKLEWESTPQKMESGHFSRAQFFRLSAWRKVGGSKHTEGNRDKNRISERNSGDLRRIPNVTSAFPKLWVVPVWFQMQNTPDETAAGWWMWGKHTLLWLNHREGAAAHPDDQRWMSLALLWIPVGGTSPLNKNLARASFG